MTIDHNDPRVLAFRCACWDYLRGIRMDQPRGEDFDLCRCTAQSLAADCYHQFESSIIKKAQEAVYV